MKLDWTTGIENRMTLLHALVHWYGESREYDTSSKYRQALFGFLQTHVNQKLVDGIAIIYGVPQLDAVAWNTEWMQHHLEEFHYLSIQQIQELPDRLRKIRDRVAEVKLLSHEHYPDVFAKRKECRNGILKVCEVFQEIRDMLIAEMDPSSPN